MIGAVMALMHLPGPGADGQPQHLVAEADAEGRGAGSDDLLNHRHCVFAGLGGIAGAVGQEHAVGLHRQDVRGRGGRRHHRDLAAFAGQQPQDVALDAVVDGDDVEFRRGLPAKTLVPLPRGFVPGKTLAGGDHRHQVHAFEAGPFAGFFLQPVQVEHAVLGVGDHGVGHALLADQRGQCPCVDAGQADDAARLQPLVEMAGGAVIRGIGDSSAQDHAARARRRRHVHRLDILVVGADIADMREGEGDELPGIGGIGEDLLITGHRGVETDFADRLAFRAEAEALQHGAIGKHEERGRLEVRPG